MTWGSCKGGCAQKKVAIEAPKDKSKEQAKRDKQVAPEATKPPSCLHCGGFHTLVECPDLTDEQLVQILIQMVAHKEEMRCEDDGGRNCIKWGSLQQSSNGVIKKNFLYIDMCLTEDQMVDQTY